MNSVGSDRRAASCQVSGATSRSGQMSGNSCRLPFPDATRFDVPPIKRAHGGSAGFCDLLSFGRAFEHWVWMELRAHLSYARRGAALAYWRTSSQVAVDFVVGDAELAIEAKGTRSATDAHLRGLRAFRQEHHPRPAILVTCDPTPRRTSDGIWILPWRIFSERLWSGELWR